MLIIYIFINFICLDISVTHFHCHIWVIVMQNIYILECSRIFYNNPGYSEISSDFFIAYFQYWYLLKQLVSIKCRTLQYQINDKRKTNHILYRLTTCLFPYIHVYMPTTACIHLRIGNCLPYFRDITPRNCWQSP